MNNYIMPHALRRRKQSRAGGGAASQKRAICFTDKQAKKLKFRKPPVFIKSIILTRIWNSTCCAIVISAILYLITFIQEQNKNMC